MGTHSSIPAWRILEDRGAWQATACGLQKRVRHDLVNKQQHNSVIILKQKAEKNIILFLDFYLEKKKKKLNPPNPKMLSLQEIFFSLKEIH